MTRCALNQDQLDAVYYYAKANGPQWKAKLMDAWEGGNYKGAPNSHLLQQVRNIIPATSLPSLLNGYIVHHASEAQNVD